MSPSWYDILDVDPSASDDAIRAAWKSAIADLDPTDRRFRVRNQAAEVLLDPQRRAAYDAELAAEVASSDEELAAPVSLVDPSVDERPSLITDLSAEKAAKSEAKGQARAEAKAARKSRTNSESSESRPGRVVPGWLLAGVALLTAAAVGGATWLWFADSDESVETATRAAQAAAETAIVPILSYDATNLEQDQAAAQSYMTTDYQVKYDQLFAVIRENAPETETVVTAEVLVSGIVRSGSDRVDILLFVNRPTTNKLQKTPVVYKDQVTVTMQKVGDDWLVDDLVTTPAGG